MKSAYINATNCITPLGLDSATNFQSLMQEKSGISLFSFPNQLTFFAGKIATDIIENDFSAFCKKDDYTFLEKISILALKPIVENMNAYELHNCGFVVATTKGNIESIRGLNIDNAKLSDYAKKIAGYFGILSEPIVVSNACVSGIYAVEVAKRLIVSGVNDNVLVLATDVVSPFVVSGFQSFQAISAEPCRPFSNDRTGVTLGEAAAAVLISSEKVENSVEILGHGSVNDANHISGPSRNGEGLYQSVTKALAQAKVIPKQIGFISAHGTATTYNDEMESIAFTRAGLGHTPIHSLKGYYGHTLGASGLLETIMSIESIQQGKLIVSKNFTEQGTSEKLNVTTKSENFDSDYFLKTASGFGGFNTAIVFKKC